jgi:hypothetical protein
MIIPEMMELIDCFVGVKDLRTKLRVENSGSSQILHPYHRGDSPGLYQKSVEDKFQS